MLVVRPIFPSFIGQRKLVQPARLGVAIILAPSKMLTVVLPLHVLHGKAAVY